MTSDPYSAIWVSHSSISDFLKCPRSYYLRNVYKNPKTGHKMTLMQPALALGQTVHAVLETLSALPVQERFTTSLLVHFEKSWEKVQGKLGGFFSKEQEYRYKERGKSMLQAIMENPRILKNKAVKIHIDLPHYYLSESDNIILCGKIDWLEYLPMTDSVAIIDFKTGKYEEREDSLQLAIYYLLVTNCQKRKVTKVCYWYLDKQQDLIEKPLPDPVVAHEKVLKIAKKIKVQRQLDHFTCKFKQGCRYCLPYEMIVEGSAEFVGINDFNQDLYILPDEIGKKEIESSIL